MEIEVKIDKDVSSPKIIILTDEITEEIELLMKNISNSYIDTIPGYYEKGVEMLKCKDIIRIYTENQKVYAQTTDNSYVVHARLYELEDRLERHSFIRISNSEIVNLNKIEKLDLSFTGTICINLKGGIKAFTSRRYVSKIKKILEI